MKECIQEQINLIKVDIDLIKKYKDNHWHLIELQNDMFRHLKAIEELLEREYEDGKR